MKRSAAGKRTPHSSSKRKFVKHSERAKLARTMTGRNVASNAADLEALPEGGLLSCFLKDAIEEENMRNPSAPYSQFYRAIYPMVQSQALLVHNKEKVVEVIIEHLGRPERVDPLLPRQLQATESLGIPSILNIVQVLARDLKAETLQQFVFPLMNACVKLIDPNDVERTTQVFQTIGKLFERCASVLLLADPSLEFQTQLYPTYLGHSSALVRNLSAETLAFLVRQQSISERKRHIWSLLKAPAESYSDGISILLTNVVRGVQGKFHSNMEKILSSALHTMSAKTGSNKYQNVQNKIRAWT